MKINTIETAITNVEYRISKNLMKEETLEVQAELVELFEELGFLYAVVDGKEEL